MLDLGKWASGDYRIKEQETETDQRLDNRSEEEQEE